MWHEYLPLNSSEYRDYVVIDKDNRVYAHYGNGLKLFNRLIKKKADMASPEEVAKFYDDYHALYASTSRPRSLKRTGLEP